MLLFVPIEEYTSDGQGQSIEKVVFSGSQAGSRPVEVCAVL
jgi:hypothetical protein